MRWIIYILLFLFTCSSYSQELHNFNKSDGLPSNTVYQISQAPDGYIWLATETGVARFDGKEFKVYNALDGLGSNENFEVNYNSTKAISFLGSNGTFSILSKEEQCNTRKEFLFSHFLSEYLVASDGREVVSSFGDGIKILNKNKIIHFKIEDGLIDNFVSFIWESKGIIYAISKGGIHAIDKSNKINIVQRFEKNIHFARTTKWKDGMIFSGTGNIYYFNSNQEIIQFHDYHQIGKRSITNIQNINNDLFISTYDGVFKVEIKGDTIFQKRSFLLGNPVSSVGLDHEGNYWFSTLNTGIYKSPNLEIVKVSPFESFGVLAKDNQLYFGLNDTKYHILEQNKISTLSLPPKNNFTTIKVKGIKNINDELWFELDAGLISLKNNTPTYYRTGVPVIEELDSKIFIGNQVGCFRFKSREELELISENNANQKLIAEVAEKIIDIKTNCIYSGNHFLLIGTQKGVFYYTNNKAKKVNLPADAVKSIDGKKDEIIICFENAGAFYINKNDTITINNNKNLSDVNFNSAIIDDKYIYLASTKGVYQIDKNTFEYQVILHQTEIRNIIIFNSQLFISSEEGIFKTPLPFKKVHSYKIPILHFKIKANNDLVSHERLSGLKYFQNDLSFDLQVANFSNLPIEYLYQLNNSKWIPFNGRLDFKELSPGQYSLKFKALAGKMSSKIIELEVVIAKPWWRTWWFFTIILLAVLILVYWFFKVRILTYNRDIVREMLQLILNKLKKEKYIILKDVRDGSNTKIILSQLQYLESSKNYVTLYSTNNSIVVRSTLKEILEQIKSQSSDFVRVHRTYVVNSKKITATHGDFLKINEIKIPFGVSYIESAKEKLELLSKKK